MSLFLIHTVLTFVRSFPLFLRPSSVERLSILGVGASAYAGYESSARCVSFREVCQQTNVDSPYRFVRPIYEFEPDGALLLRREGLDTAAADANKGMTAGQKRQPGRGEAATRKVSFICSFLLNPIQEL